MGPFVAVNCRDFRPESANLDFFGYLQGLFTGAQNDLSGPSPLACGGTLFLKDVTELPAEVQVLLSRVLQERLVQPSGNCKELSLQARIIASSSRDLEAEVAQQRMRRDFYFRLNPMRIYLDPLRERGADILLLAQHFLRQASTATKPIVGMTPATARILMTYDWPGNISELERCMARAVGVTQHDHITAADVLLGNRRNGTQNTMQELPLLMPLVERERLFILDTLQAVKGNKTLAARMLGLDRKTLARKLRNYQTSETATEQGSAKSSSR
jgi:two-component system response regulator HydG